MTVPKYPTSLLILGGLTLLLLVVGILFFTADEPTPPATETPVPETDVVSAPPTEQRIIGGSVQNRPIEVYRFGTGDTELLYVGGVHGGYEWNSILLAYEFIDYLDANLSTIPGNLTISVIPNLNPDGLYQATGLEGRFATTDITDYSMHNTGEGRFNANNVDLNRNFACNWAPESTWRGQVVSAGSAPFSEPEAQALRDYVRETNPAAAVFWHSRANAVYASECNDGVLPETLKLMNTYADAAGYAAVPSFDAYPITGDMEGWLASIGIPAVTVELDTRTSTEWQQNRAGAITIWNLYSEAE